MIRILISVILITGIATAIDPILISGKDFSDFNLTDTDLDISDDLGGEVWSNALTDDNLSGDGAPYGNKAPLLVGMVGEYNRTDIQNKKFYTPAQLESLKNTSTWLEFL